MDLGQPLSFDPPRTHDRTRVVAARGDVSALAQGSSQAALALGADALADGVRVLVLDLTGAVSLDSSGVSVIVRLAKLLRASDAELRLVSTGYVRDRLALMGVDVVIPTATTVEDVTALQAG